MEITSQIITYQTDSRRNWKVRSITIKELDVIKNLPHQSSLHAVLTKHSMNWQLRYI